MKRLLPLEVYGVTSKSWILVVTVWDTYMDVVVTCRKEKGMHGHSAILLMEYLTTITVS